MPVPKPSDLAYVPFVSVENMMRLIHSVRNRQKCGSPMQNPKLLPDEICPH